MQFFIPSMLATPVVAMAVDKASGGSLNSFVENNAGLVIAIFVVAMGIVSFFFNRLLKQNDEQHKAFLMEIKLLWKAHGIEAQKLSNLQGQHDGIMQSGTHARRFGDAQDG
jgi:hypothetical protein